MKHKVAAVYSKLDDKFLQQFGFRIRETTLEKIVDYMFVPKDASCLAFTRIVFGIAMFFDTASERGGEYFEDIWGDPNSCFFPLVPFIVPTTLPKMAVVYASLWIATLGIALGYKYRFSCKIYILCYWYIVLIDKSVWNNHTYLFGLVAILLACTDAGRYWSLDVYIDPWKKKESVPYWNYFILKYQFFILYFMAGIKKCSREWLEGYSVAEIQRHWVFDLFKLFLTPPQINKYIIHYFISVFDLTISMWMMWSRSRNIAVLFCSLFHFMNMRIFDIGMFPWLCLGTIPLFYPFDMTKRKLRAICPFTDIIKELSRNIFCHCYSYLKIYENITYENNDDPAESHKTEELTKENSSGSNKDVKNRTEINELEVSSSTKFVNSRSEEYQEKTIAYKKNKHKHNNTPMYKKKRTVLIIFLYMVWQAFMPFSHFITKGYNTWTEGLYGYSWDMMIYGYTQAAVTVRVVDNAAHTEFFFDRNNTRNERWAEHADMVYQYAHCIKETMRRYNEVAEMRNEPLVDENISIYIDAWVSLNGRFHQRMFDPDADMLSVTWSPFETPSYVLPLLEEASGRRDETRQIEQRIKSFSNDTDVLFFVSLPGHTIERFITPDLEGVAVTVLNGTALFVTDEDSLHSGQSYKLTNGEAADVPTDCFHKVTNIGHTLLYFMYTERCPELSCNANDRRGPDVETKLKLPIYEEFMGKLRGIAICAQLLIKHIASGCIKCLNGRPFETK